MPEALQRRLDDMDANDDGLDLHIGRFNEWLVPVEKHIGEIKTQLSGERTRRRSMTFLAIRNMRGDGVTA